MDRITVQKALGGRLFFNFLVKDGPNAREVWDASEGFAIPSIALRDFGSVVEACRMAMQVKAIAGIVSISLGGGDSSQWERVVEVAMEVDPGHVNQVFPATGYTIGALNAKGYIGNVVNGLVSPSGVPGEVVVSTGPRSSHASAAAIVDSETALQMLAEVGGNSVKVFPADGDSRLSELSAIARAAETVGIRILEPTGGITTANLHRVLGACLPEGPEIVIPHIHGSIIDRETGRTDPEAVAEIVAIGKTCLGIA